MQATYHLMCCGNRQEAIFKNDGEKGACVGINDL
jgi:hypothetical protein